MVLAEGIEDENDLGTALALGARWGQGWLFGRPGPLRALAGRTVRDCARLRPPHPSLHLPTGTPFSLASASHFTRTADRRMVEALTEHVLSLATLAGPHAVLLGGFADTAVGRAWLPRLRGIAATTALVGVAGPALAAANPYPVRVAAVPTDQAGTETALALVSPHATVALCVRPRGGDILDLVLTHDPNLVYTIARMLLGRLDGAAERATAPAPATVAGSRT
jgi:hypothetical protein